MDFLDPKKQRRHTIMLMTGYLLIGIAIVIGTTILLYQSYGFGVNRRGQVIQNGLVFFSSQPNPANIYLNGTLKTQTNSRVMIPAGQYQVKLTRNGYRDWQRLVTVQGGDVQHFDYPFLIPNTLTPTSQASYTSAPGLATQSPDQRWLIIEKAGSISDFDLYDLKTPGQAATTISLPADLLTKATGSQSWQLVEWSNDNQHILLEHDYDGQKEYILVDRQNPDQSVNLSRTLDIKNDSLALNNKKYDQYYLFNPTSGELDTASLTAPTPVVYLTHVLAYKSYGDRDILYATDDGADSGKTLIDLYDGTTSHPIRQVAAGTTYLLDMATYNGTPYVVVGAASENRVYIFKDPLGQLSSDNQQQPTAIRVLMVTNPSYVSFSTNAQFIVAENGTQFAVYDDQHNHMYSYKSPLDLDAPQTHASWMDGDRLTYVSGGKLQIFDYDHNNPQTLIAASPAYLPFFAPDYHYVYTVAPEATTGAFDLDRTPLLTPADL